MHGIPKRSTYRVLDRAAIDQIHQAALQILERTGTAVRREEYERLLLEHGCARSTDGKRVCVPSALVEETLRKKQGEITLAARDPKFDLVLDREHTYITNDGNGTMTMDFETRERRPSRKADVALAAHLSMQLPYLHLDWPTVTAQDVPPSTRHLHDLEASLLNTTKHIMVATTTTVQEARDIVKVGQALAGGPKELRRRAVLSSIHTTISPLTLEGDLVEGAIHVASAGIPAAAFAMPTPGASGPVTLAGSVAVACAEVLAMNTVMQLAAPGSPIIFGCGVAALDMKAATRGGGGPEHALTSCALTEMAHFYGMPSLVGGFETTAREPGAQACYEKFASGLPQMLVGADMICGIGLLEDSRTLWLEQLLIDHEMIRIMERLSRGIEVGPETLALDVIDRVGTGTFLGQRHTMAHLKEEIFMPELTDRRSFETWTKAGAPSLEARAQERVRELLKAPRVEPPPEEVLAELRSLIGGAERRGAGRRAAS